VLKTIAPIIAGLFVAGAAHGAAVQIQVVGRVDFNTIIAGSLNRTDNPVGTPVTMSFLVDSDTYLNGSFPTRGYVIDQSSFVLNVGTTVVHTPSPYPAGSTPYFVIRNNDPAVDGFLLASHPDVAQPNGVWTDVPASFEPTFRALFSATYGGATLPSLDIMDALGAYSFNGLHVFNWGAEDASFQPIGFIFDYFTITTYPPPACLGDSDGSFVVDFNDVLTTLANYGSTGSPFGPGDSDGDSHVDFSDIITTLANFGAECAPPTAASASVE